MSICRHCGNPTKYNKFRKRYAIYCSIRCANTDPQKISKTKITCSRKYGGDNPHSSENVKNKTKQTFLKKYGVCNYSQTKCFHDEMTNRGLFIPESKQTDFQKYKLLVLAETRKWIDQLFMNWDGYDYYTRDALLTDKVNYNNKLYRTIDHKISIYKGFILNIDPLIIGNIKNLCITSRSNNCRKKESSVFS